MQVAVHRMHLYMAPDHSRRRGGYGVSKPYSLHRGLLASHLWGLLNNTRYQIRSKGKYPHDNEPLRTVQYLSLCPCRGLSCYLLYPPIIAILDQYSTTKRTYASLNCHTPNKGAVHAACLTFIQPNHVQM